MRKFFVSLAAAGMAVVATAAFASEGGHLKKIDWSWQGVFGTYDRAAQQRGFQVYKDICANCHSLRLVAYRNLSGIGLSEDEIKAVAATAEVKDGPNDAGDMFTRAGRPSDRFKQPFPNDNAARAANNGALPPDLTLMTKARVGGPDYLYSLLTGYSDAPAGHAMPEGMYYNTAFAGNNIAMAQPIMDDMVSYADGTKATVDQMSRDVTTFLQWAAEPELEERHSMGVKVMLFLVVLTALFYALKRKIWADVH